MNMRHPEGPGYIERIDMDEIERKVAAERAEQARLAEEPLEMGGKADPKVEVRFAGSGEHMAEVDSKQVKNVEGEGFNRDRIAAELKALQEKIKNGADPLDLLDVVEATLPSSR